MFCACASCQTARDRSAPLPMRYGSVKHQVQSLCEVIRSADGGQGWIGERRGDRDGSLRSFWFRSRHFRDRGNGSSLLVEMGEISPQKMPRCRSPLLTPEDKELQALVVAAMSMRPEVKDNEPEPESDCFKIPSSRECTGTVCVLQTCPSCQTVRFGPFVRFCFVHSGSCGPPMKEVNCPHCSGQSLIPGR